jgi:aspartyl-tRNA(Asn)/glutamyl-tRNA(Gln) amidotransferase subunit A
MAGLTSLTLADLAAGYRTGALDPRDVTAAYLEAIEGRNPALNAYIAVLADNAQAEAEASAMRWKTGTALGALDGVPIAIKDNIDLAGVPTTNGCAFGPVAVVDAGVSERLKAAGAVILGKLNMHEAALGATTDNPHWGRAQNPHRQGWTPGGSSGGSGVAVAAELAAATLGSDTMGSVRVPAAYCGCYGIKPTYGLVSTRGVAPLAWTLDHVGPLTKTPEDLAILLEALIGHDMASPDSERITLDRTPFDPANMTVGHVRQINQADMHADVRDAYEAFLENLHLRGAKIVELDWDGFVASPARRAGLLISEAEAGFALADDLGNRPERFSDGLRDMLNFGRSAPAAKLVKAERQVREVRRLVRNSFIEADIIALPTTPMPPFPFDGEHPVTQADFCAPANFAGCPALSLPSGETQDGLPIGMQLMADTGRDFGLIGLASAIS